MTETCHVAVVRHKVLHGPLKIRQCVMCHLPLPGTDHKFRLAEQNEKLCLGCHKPVIRFRFMHKDVVDGKCLNCHAPHGSENKSMLRQESEDLLCQNCHKDIGTKRFFHIRNAPERCTPCHRAHGGPYRKFLKTPAAKGCISCHANLVKKPQTLHLGKVRDCTACHRIHDADFPKLLKTDVKTTCLKCHPKIELTAAPADSKHSALVTDPAGCVACHNPHASPRKHLLKSAEDGLCFRCHTKTEKEIEGAGQKHTALVKGECTLCHNVHKTNKDGLFKPRARNCFSCHKQLPRYTFMHTDYRKGQCQKCHSPHAGTKKSLLKAASTDDLCLSCHKDVVLLKRRHVPLEKGGCLTCHRPHGSPTPKFLAQPGVLDCIACHRETFKGMKPTAKPHSLKITGCRDCHRLHDSDSPKLLEMEAPTLCMGCHTDILKSAAKKTFKHRSFVSESRCGDCHLPHFSARKRLLKDWEIKLCLPCHEKTVKKIAEAAYQHGPITKGECTACHEMHRDGSPHLLKAQMESKPFVPYDPERFALCFKCHNRSIVEEAETDKTTRFRNGRMNLHFVHLVRTQKGHTCTVCHDPHSGSDRKLLRESFQLAGWAVPLEYRETESGGTCRTACHVPQMYDRVTAVENPPLSKPQAP